MLVRDVRAFPPTPPASLGDTASVVDNDWNAFKAIDRMDDHWDRPGWSDSHRALYWMITVPQSEALVEEAQWCQQQLAQLRMDPVPADGLHITMNKVGSRQQVSSRQAAALAESVRGKLGTALRLVAHPMAGSRGAVRFTVTPWTELVTLHAALARAGADLGVPGGRPTELFRPHLGILYNNRVRPAAEPINGVAALRGRPPIEFMVGAVHLVELRREARAYRWDVLHEVALRPAVLL